MGQIITEAYPVRYPPGWCVVCRPIVNGAKLRLEVHAPTYEQALRLSQCALNAWLENEGTEWLTRQKGWV